jgi:hypothetical protein
MSPGEAGRLYRSVGTFGALSGTVETSYASQGSAGRSTVANERLLTAMERTNVTVNELATVTEKDPKTVSRWIGGRVPHPRTRFQIAKAVGEDEDYLWPGIARKSEATTSVNGEIVATYPFRSKLPSHEWWKLISSANSQIDLLGYTLYFLALEHPELVATLEEKCAAGCRVRAAIADPRSSHVAYRDDEEKQPITLVARIHTTLKYFRPLVGRDGFEVRYQDVPLYNSVFRFDDQMLVTPHLFATPGSAAPLLHLRSLSAEGLFSRFAGHFEDVWATTTAVPDEDWTGQA